MKNVQKSAKFVLLTVLRGRNANVSFEYLRKVIGIRITDARRDFAHRNVCCAQQLCRTVDAVSGQIFQKRAVVRGAKQTGKIKGAHALSLIHI